MSSPTIENLTVYLDRFRACPEGRDWVRGFPAAYSIDRLWKWCTRGDWMVWWLAMEYMAGAISLDTLRVAVAVALRAQLTEKEALPSALAAGLRALETSSAEDEALTEVDRWVARSLHHPLEYWGDSLAHALRMGGAPTPLQVCNEALCAVPDTSVDVRAAADAIRLAVPWEVASRLLTGEPLR